MENGQGDRRSRTVRSLKNGKERSIRKPQGQLRIVNIDESNLNNTTDMRLEEEDYVITKQEEMFFPNVIENKKSGLSKHPWDRKHSESIHSFGKCHTPINMQSFKSKNFFSNENENYYDDGANQNIFNTYNNFSKAPSNVTGNTNQNVPRSDSHNKLDKPEKADHRYTGSNAQKSPIIQKDNYFEEKIYRKVSTLQGSDRKSEANNNYLSYFPDKSPIRANKGAPNFHITGKSTTENPYFNTTILNLVNEIKDPNKSRLNMNFGEGASIYLPMNTEDLDEELKLAEAGYMEEDDEDLKSSGMSGGFFGLDDDDENFNFKPERDDDRVNELNKSIDNQVAVNQTLLDSKKPTLCSKDEIDAVLFPKSQFDINPNQTYFIKTVILENGVEVIDEDLLIIILNFLYLELHNGLIELGDNFLEERRKYFQTNFDTYLSIVNYFLKSKEEFFLGILSQIMSKLSISQVLLDSSLNFYMNEAVETPKVNEIKLTYEKVYRAGEKYSIAPKIITKLRLKNILNFQLETYQDLMNKYQELSNDVLEIIVTDTVYSEFGFDREAIRAAIQKHDIYKDKSFEEVIYKLEEYRNSSFLNI